MRTSLGQFLVASPQALLLSPMLLLAGREVSAGKDQAPTHSLSSPGVLLADALDFKSVIEVVCSN